MRSRGEENPGNSENQFPNSHSLCAKHSTQFFSDSMSSPSTEGHQDSSSTAPLYNSDGRPPYSSIDDLVRLNGGNRVIRRVLIANNGNAAIKAIRSLRQWSFSMVGNDRAVEFVIMATMDDIEANQEYTSEGDFLVEVPSGPTNSNYANLYLIVQIAEEHSCDAVWPGWGHASENYKLPLALSKSPRRPVWIGPSVSSMLLLGDKIGSIIIAQFVNVPCVPWSGSHVRCSAEDLEAGTLSQDLLDLACITTTEEALDICERLGYPLMIKASAGGGGKGIRKVFNRSEVGDAFHQVVNEVKGSPVFIMKLVEKCRHLEVQIISDRYGNTQAIGSRDCSIQRRCQKIIEEGPIVTAPRSVVEQMEAAAIRLCSAVKYCNAATCEFIYDLETKNIYFLEVNARLQVEHVVTEVVADVNLPAAQLQIAMGIPLSSIPDLQRLAVSKSSNIQPFRKHCIAARITAEHAEDNFRPTCGDVFELQLRTSMNVWGYFCIGATGKVHAYTDSQIGHIFASGRDRESARKHLIMALKGLTVRGEIRTNVEALLNILQLPDFITNNTHTTWVESSVNFGSLKSLNLSNEEMLLQAVLVGAAYEAFVTFNRSQAAFLEKISQGQLPPCIKVQTSSELVYKNSRFDITCYHTGPYTISVELNNSSSEVLLRPITSSTNHTTPSEHHVDLSACFLASGGFDGRSRRIFYKSDNSGIRVTFDGSTFTFTKETDPSQVRAPISGKLSRWLVTSGTEVQRGQPYAEIEIMKMYMQLQVPEAGILSHALAEGAVFKSGDLLATLEFSDGVVLEKAERFSGTFPISDKQGSLKSERLSCDSFETKTNRTTLRNFRIARDRLIGSLSGYRCCGPETQENLDLLVECLFDQSLPQLEVAEALSVMEPNLPTLLATQLHAALKFESTTQSTELIKTARAGNSNAVSNDNDQLLLSFGGTLPNSGENDSLEVLLNAEKLEKRELPTCHMFDIIEDYLVGQAVSGETPAIARIQLEPLTDLLRKYENGLLASAIDMFVSLLTQYLDVEEIFHLHDSESAAKVILLKRTEVDAQQLAVLARSHHALSQKNELIIKVLGCIRQTPGFMELLPLFSDPLQRLSDLSKPEYAEVSLRARQLLLTRKQRSFVERTLSLVDSILDYFERCQPLVGNHSLLTSHSPTTSKGHLLPTPMTPVASLPPFGASGLYSGLGSSSVLSLGQTSLGQTTNSLVQHFISDLDEVGDDSLIALLGHPLGQLRKLVFEILIRRHYDRWGVHDLRIQCDGEFWINASSSDDNKASNAWRQKSTMTPSRWGGSHLNVFSQESPALNEGWGSGAQPPPLWALPNPIGTPTWRSVTPRCQNLPKFFDGGIDGAGVGTSNPSIERLSHFPSVQNSGFSQSYCVRSVHPDEADAKLRDEEDRPRQRANRLLAVWIHTSVMTKEFLTGTCDLIKSTRTESPPPMDPSSPIGDSHAFRANPLSAVDEGGGYDGSMGLDSESRLHHMLNAFAGVGGESSDLPVGKSQMTVAMAFATFEQFKTTFALCLEEYGALQECMPPAPPGPDGKILMVFIPDVSQISECGQRNSTNDLNEYSNKSKSTRSPLSVNAHLEVEIQNHSSQLNSLGFNLIGVGFLHGRHLEDFQTEMNRTRYDPCFEDQLDRSLLSSEFISRRRVPSSSDDDGPAIRRSSFPPFDDLPSRQRSSTHSTIGPVDISNFDPLLPISEAGELSSVSMATSPPCSKLFTPPLSSSMLPSSFAPLSSPISSPSPAPQTSSIPLPDEVILPTKPGPFSTLKVVQRTVCPRRLSPDRAFSDVGLVGSSQPRYAYFRNLTELPSSTERNGAGTPSVGPETEGVNGTLKQNNADPTYLEEPLLRNAICTEFSQLELKRLCNFHVKVEPTTVPNIHMYEATPKLDEPSGKVASVAPGPSRLFVRILLHYKMNNDDQDIAEQERYFVAALNALEIALKSNGNLASRPSPSHHILMSIILQTTSPNAGPATSRASGAHQRLSPAAAESSTMALAKRYQQRLMKNRVDVVEVRFAQRSLLVSDTFVPIRLVITNPTGQSLIIQKFVEITDPTTGDLIYSALDASDSLAISGRQPFPLQSSHSKLADLPRLSSQNLTSMYSRPPAMSQKGLGYDGLPVCTPHPLAGPLDEKRAMAASLSTIYIYDFLDLFEEAIKKQWRSCPKYFVPSFCGDQTTSSDLSSPGISVNPKSPDTSYPTTFLPDRVLESVELKLDDRGEVQEVHRDPGLNECGMVAWRVVMRTPEFPRGRRIILIGNDVTFYMGTFGVQEDLLFQRVSEVARKQGIPRVYIAVNSGARMGLAAEVQRVFRIEWLNADQPSQGFKYLYITDTDYKKLKLTESVVCDPVQHPQHGKIYRITSVIGSQIGLGVENLCGSGAIAGETSRAYQSNMTITFVTGRTVGIGAYITRLGHRVIQKANNAPILLTGYQALNRLIGRDVYCSNDAIGGVDIMSRNGISHIVVEDDIEGCEEVIRWLSYVPEHREGPLPIMVDPTDPITRPVLYKVQSLTEDPRLMLTGCVDSRGKWLGGIFDNGSFREVLSDWAKSVIVGRARLGGIPVGVIAVETRVTESILPADPAMSNSVETKLVRAGQVWFPDSAYKTAQSINDFNREEIPLIIFANWRGFSGGQRDMFHEVLKFGSFIVDALVDFKQPCLVYIPPKSELRGGAWVVVDPRINSNYMEMFADPQSRGGVLEPTGTVEIKFRSKALIELAGRLDHELQSLAEEDKILADEGVARDDSRRQALKEKKDRRLHELMPIYKQVAIHFADLHDTATRMKHRSAISDIVPWERSRVFFYWRLRRQLIFFNLRSEIVKADPSLSLPTAEHLIDKWAKESGHAFFNSRPTSLSAACSLNSKFVHWACHSLAEISKHLGILRREYFKRKVQSISREEIMGITRGTPSDLTLRNLFRNEVPLLSHTPSVVQSTFNGLDQIG